MYDVKNFADSDNVQVLDQKGPFVVIEHLSDLSVTPYNAVNAYYSAQMNVRKRQVLCELEISPVTVQSGAMQWMVGNVEMTTGIKGAGDLIGKMFRGAASGEAAIKPEYKGTGSLVLEPTYKHLILVDTREWNNSVIVEDGMFLACESKVNQKAIARSTVSSAVLGGEGLFNLGLFGEGIVCLESDCPQAELVEITLENDVLKIDGSLAVAWSGSLEFTVERSGKSLIGSAASGEGLVNVYRGTGRVLMAPLQGNNFTRPVTTQG